ncbi:sensor histidine kinase [Hymenobacter coccineus]|uniref:histidine kinase n=1 Tax=Hymenobacter coccineus TaxID=1908235 RepID=A0A1G1TLF9_9BACT|nr:HAMP domain-containing sensor histidine kinase [Hymenobacter coccineus]OGX91685.1 hypothetical protein BEN49_18990 [Hymenobacter coccineus]
MLVAPKTEALLTEAELLARLFPGGGEMGERIRQLDWSATLLGPAHGWPQSLRTAVRIMLSSRFPMMVHWGPELVHFYNDGYATILQGKHSGALGQPAEPWWREMWPFLLGIFQPVLAGQTTYFENSLVLPNRRGFVEEAYFTFSHSPLYDEAGTVGGIFVTALETTPTVLQHRRLALLSRLTAQMALLVPPAEAAQHLIAALATNAEDLPFALLYTQEPTPDHAALQAWFGLPAGEPTAPARLAFAETRTQGWPLQQAQQQRTPVLVPSLEERLGPLPAGTWPEAPRQALLFSLAPGDAGGPATVLVLGLSSRRPLDDDYRAFLALVADYAGRALARARAAHESQRLNQVLREMNASLDSLVHIVAHDLKGPVTNLQGLLDVYHQEAPEAAQHRVVAMFDQEVHRLSGTVQGLLKLLHSQHGAVALPAEAVAWRDVYTAVEAELADFCRQQHGTLTADFTAAPTVCFPRVYLESILKNLVHNALKYRAPERAPVVYVRTARQGPLLVLTVADNGRGIDLPRDREQLFQPFMRLSTEGEGEGLALHMLQTLVRQRGGEFDVASTPGAGSTFTVRLPEEIRPDPA